MKKQKETITSLTFKMFPLPNIHILNIPNIHIHGVEARSRKFMKIALKKMQSFPEVH